MKMNSMYFLNHFGLKEDRCIHMHILVYRYKDIQKHSKERIFIFLLGMLCYLHIFTRNIQFSNNFTNVHLTLIVSQAGNAQSEVSRPQDESGLQERDSESRGQERLGGGCQVRGSQSGLDKRRPQ